MGIAPAWDATLTHYAGYTEQELIECVAGVHECLLSAEQTLPAVYKKYANKKLLETSTRPEINAFIQKLATTLRPGVTMSMM